MLTPDKQKIAEAIRYMEACDTDGNEPLTRTPRFNEAWNTAISVLRSVLDGSIFASEEEIKNILDVIGCHINGINASVQALSRIPKQHHSHSFHSAQDDVKKHDNMTMTLLAEHLGVDLYIAMEICRYAIRKERIGNKDAK